MATSFSYNVSSAMANYYGDNPMQNPVSLGTGSSLPSLIPSQEETPSFADQLAAKRSTSVSNIDRVTFSPDASFLAGGAPRIQNINDGLYANPVDRCTVANGISAVLRPNGTYSLEFSH